MALYRMNPGSLERLHQVLLLCKEPSSNALDISCFGGGGKRFSHATTKALERQSGRYTVSPPINLSLSQILDRYIR